MFTIPPKTKHFRIHNAVREIAKLGIKGLTLAQCRPILELAPVFELIKVRRVNGTVEATFKSDRQRPTLVTAHDAGLSDSGVFQVSLQS